RVRDYAPEMLDELTSSGEVVWVGAGGGPGNDGLVALLPAEAVPDLAPEPAEVTGPVAAAVLEVLAGAGGMFFPGLAAGGAEALPDGAATGEEVVSALWEVTWAGLVTNDTLAPLRGPPVPVRAMAGLQARRHGGLGLCRSRRSAGGRWWAGGPRPPGGRPWRRWRRSAGTGWSPAATPE